MLESSVVKKKKKGGFNEKTSQGIRKTCSFHLGLSWVKTKVRDSESDEQEKGRHVKVMR